MTSCYHVATQGHILGAGVIDQLIPLRNSHSTWESNPELRVVGCIPRPLSYMEEGSIETPNQYK
jgi:hypothetical protein